MRRRRAFDDFGEARLVIADDLAHGLSDLWRRPRELRGCRWRVASGERHLHGFLDLPARGEDGEHTLGERGQFLAGRIGVDAGQRAHAAVSSVDPPRVGHHHARIDGRQIAERKLDAECRRVKMDRDAVERQRLRTPAATASSVANGTDSPAPGEPWRFDTWRIGGTFGIVDLSPVKRAKSGYFLSSRSMVEKAPGTGGSENMKRTDGSPRPAARNAAWIRSSSTESGSFFVTANVVSSATCM